MIYLKISLRADVLFINYLINSTKEDIRCDCSGQGLMGLSNYAYAALELY